MKCRGIKALLLFAFTSIFFYPSLYSVHPGSRGMTLPPVEGISKNEAKEFLFQFQHQRLKADYSLNFELEHLKRRKTGAKYTGTLWGTWNDEGQVIRFSINLGNGKKLDGLAQSGARSRMWVLEDSGYVRELSQDQLWEPLAEGLVYRPVDLMLSFAYWPKAQYEGSERVMGRPAHIYMMLPPKDISSYTADLQGVKLVIDSVYRAPIKAEWMGRSGDKLRSFKVLDFKKAGEEWVVKTIDFVDEVAHEKTRFKVVDAQTGLRIERDLFNPRNLNKEIKKTD